jgi:hypothetical protein
MLVETTAERVARNEATFRSANERLEEGFAQFGPSVDRVPFLCECLDRACKQATSLTLGEYEAVRSHGTRFLVAPGHEQCVVDGESIGRVVERYDRYTVVEKTGRAGEIAEELDPRAD